MDMSRIKVGVHIRTVQPTVQLDNQLHWCEPVDDSAPERDAKSLELFGNHSHIKCRAALAAVRARLARLRFGGTGLDRRFRVDG